MNIIKFLLIFLILGLISAGAYVVNKQQQVFPSVLANFSPQVSEKFVFATNQVQTQIDKIKLNQIKPLGEKLEESKIVEVDTSEKPVHQKAMEYARYEYCKQVIRDFEQK